MNQNIPDNNDKNRVKNPINLGGNLNKKVKIILSLCFTLFFLCYVIFKVNWSLFYQLISNINVWFLILGIATYFATYLLRTTRLKILLPQKNITLISLLGINFIHNFYNRILPARLGDFTLIFLLKKCIKGSINSSVNIFILIKIYDLLLNTFLLAISYTVLYRMNVITCSIWLMTIIILILSIKPSFILKIIQKITHRYNKWSYIVRLNHKLPLLIADSKLMENNKTRFYLFLTSLFIWFFLSIFFYILLLSINRNYGFWNTIFASSLANFSWVLPINGIGGFGTMEISMAYSFSLRGLPFNEVLVSALYINVTIFILSTLFAVIPCTMLFKRRNKNETNYPNSMSE